MWHGLSSGVWLTAADASSSGLEDLVDQLSARWPALVVMLGALAVLANVLKNVETVAKPVRGLWARRPRWLRREQPPPPPSAAELTESEASLRSRMHHLWVDGDRAPLPAAEHDSPSVLRYLGLMADAALLHPSRRDATTLATGEAIALDDSLGPGGLFELLDESMLIVGAPGGGKSVLLWQILRDRLAAADSDPSTAVPVLLELHRWATIDPGEGRVPDFAEFVVAELAAPSVGMPPEYVRALMARDRLVYLLDGLDELSDDFAARCLRALASFAAGPGDRPRRRVALTCREDDYHRLLDQYPSGTGAVVNALRITPFAPQLIQDAFDRAEPSPGRLPEAADRLPALRQLLGIPLWLSVAEDVYQHDPHADPLTAVGPYGDARQVQAALFAAWLDPRVPADSVQRQLGFLASTMHANGQQTLYLETVQPVWLTPAGYDRVPARLTGLALGLVFALLSGLLFGPVYGPVVGLLVGLVGGLVGGLGAWSLAADAMHEPPVVADRAWSWRAALTRETLVPVLGPGLALVLVFGLVVGLLFGPVYGPVYGPVVGLVVALGVGLLTIMLAEGWVVTPAVEGRSARPTDALLRSARHGASMTLVSGLVVGLVVGLGLGPVFGLGAGLVGGLVFGLVFGLERGLGALVAHSATRITAAVHGLLPVRLVAFLNNATTHGIMYPAGPGYRFRHRTLAEHLARGPGSVATKRRT